MNRRIILLVMSIYIFSCSFVYAGGTANVGGGFATELTQILNYGQSVYQVVRQTAMVINQAQQIQNQLKQLKSIEVFSSGQWSSAMGLLNQLQSVVQQGHAISYAMQNIDQAFQQTYSGYVPTEDYTTQYQTWSTSTLDTIKGSLMAIGLQSNSFATENATLTTLRSMSDSSVGQTQAIQVGNMINNEMISQLQKLRQIQMSQIQSESAYMAHQVNKEAADEANLDAIFQYIDTVPGQETVIDGTM